MKIGRKQYDAIKLSSVYAPENAISRLQQAIENDSDENVKVFYLNEEKATQLGLESASRSDAVGPKSWLKHRIDDPGANVNMNISDQTQTVQFKRWFGDSAVKKNDGTPKVM